MMGQFFNRVADSSARWLADPPHLENMDCHFEKYGLLFIIEKRIMEFGGDTMSNVDCEVYRSNTVSYLWRCEAKEKERLFVQAAREGRPANKVLSDALTIYLRLPEDVRKIKLGQKMPKHL